VFRANNCHDLDSGDNGSVQLAGGSNGSDDKNDDPVNQCRLVRIHMFDSLLETMRAVMDPMVLFEEAEDTLVSMQELSQIQWPDDHRPEE